MIDLSEIPVVDNHVHPWRPSTQHMSADGLAGEVAFSESVVASVRQEFLPIEQLGPSLKLFRDTNLGARYLLTELARFLGVEDNWSAVETARNAGIRCCGVTYGFQPETLADPAPEKLVDSLDQFADWLLGKA